MHQNLRGSKFGWPKMAMTFMVRHPTVEKSYDLGHDGIDLCSLFYKNWPIHEIEYPTIEIGYLCRWSLVR